METIEVDALVVGAGIGGLTVARGLAERGQSVMVVEKAEAIGGSAVLSEGYVWTAPDLETFRAEDPLGDEEKFLVMLRELEPALDEIASAEIGVGPLLTGVLDFGRGRQIDIAAYLDWCARVVTRGGGWIMLGHSPTELLNEGTAVIGAEVVSMATGEKARVRAVSTILATGGFQASERGRLELMGPWARGMLLRANPLSLGTGLELGRGAGAALSAQLDRFYGHLVPFPLAEWNVDIFTRLTNYHSKFGLLLDRSGRRFTDEGRGDHANAQSVARHGSALLFIDSRVWQSAAIASPVEGMPSFDRVQDARDFGAHVSVADTLDELARPAEQWGFDAGQIVRTIDAYNGGVADPAHGSITPLTEPPFALVQVQAAITFTYGGLRTDTDGRVLGESGAPIPGLYAAGVDSGGVNAVGYTGGLVRGLTLGRATARAIADAAPAVTG